MPQDSKPSEMIIDVEPLPVKEEGPKPIPADLRAAHERISRDIARLAYDFTVESYVAPSTPMLRPWKPWTRRKGDGERQDAPGHFARTLEDDVRKEISRLPDDVKNQYLADILVDVFAQARGVNAERLFRTPKESKERAREERIRRSARELLAADAQQYVAALGDDIHLDELIESGVVQPFRHFISPYLHVLEKDRIILNARDEEGNPEQVMIAPWRHKQRIIDDAVERNTTHSAKYLHRIHKRHSIDNTLHLWLVEYFVHHMRTHSLRDVPVIGLDQSRFAINRDHVDEYGVIAYPFRDKLDRITVMMRIADIWREYAPEEIDGFQRNIEYIAHKLGARGKHLLHDPSTTKEMEQTDITQDDLGGDRAAALLKSERGKDLIRMLNVLDNAAEFNMIYFDGPLSKRIPDQFSLSEGLRAQAEEKMKDDHAAYFYGPDKHWPHLRTRLNADNGGIIWGGTHAVYTLFTKDHGNLETIVEKYEDVLPFSAETIKQFQKRADTFMRFANGVVRLVTFGKHKNATEKLRDPSLTTFHSEIPPNRVGGLFSEHRFALYGWLGMRAMKNVADKTQGSKFAIFRDELVETARTGRWREFAADMLFYNPDETGRRIHGKVVVDELPEAQAAMRFNAMYRLTGNYLLEDAQDVMAILKDRVIIEPHNVHLRYVAATSLFFTGQERLAQRHFEALRDTLIDNDSLSELSNTDKRYAKEHLLAGSYYFLAQAMGKARNPQEYLETLQKGYESATLEVRTEHLSRGGRPMRVRDSVEVSTPELEEDDPLDAMEAVIYAPYSIDARRRAVVAMKNRDRAKKLAYQTALMISDLGDALTEDDREKAKSFYNDSLLAGITFAPGLARSIERITKYKEAKPLIAGDARPVGQRKITSDISDALDNDAPDLGALRAFMNEHIVTYDPSNLAPLEESYLQQATYDKR